MYIYQLEQSPPTPPNSPVNMFGEAVWGGGQSTRLRLAGVNWNRSTLICLKTFLIQLNLSFLICYMVTTALLLGLL